ncbi:metallophosphoesterase [Halorubrum sp. SD626R]|uniref:metallophosphoesterase n=1 Tax=Halorubrum sp. SD626R TaxID=1419722 RepID=UPI000B0BA74E|nr:metallophosphoesterase [Halorubrum sp. SD626R]TKX80176.1 metallophosphoesterase [Halorubrum sp. SD626R]
MAPGASPSVEPVVGEPAAVADLGRERALLVADIHAGIEVGLRYERGVELDDRADERRERLCGLLAETDADRLVVLGDLAHRIAAPEGEEREELAALIRAVTDRVPMTLVEGNHDAGVAEAFADDLDVIGTGGSVIGASDRGDGDSRSGTGGVGVLHGHTWPDPALCDADVVCMGHEHPQVRLEDAVGGSRVERAWLRGRLDPGAFVEGRGTGGDADAESDATGDPPELVVFPAFNERSGGTWVNVDGQSFLAPFLPDALPAGDAYLLNGTRLGDFRRI